MIRSSCHLFLQQIENERLLALNKHSLKLFILDLCAFVFSLLLWYCLLLYFGCVGIGFKKRFFLLIYFCYYSAYLYCVLFIGSVAFLILFMCLTVLFNYILVLSIILLAKKFQFQLNKIFPYEHSASQIKFL